MIEIKKGYISHLDIDLDGDGIPEQYRFLGIGNHNYSTEEQIVGTWIDGKPIYEKTLIFNNQYLDSGFTDILHGIDNIDSYVDLKGSYKNLSNSNLLLLSHMNTNGLHLSIGMWCENKTEIRISTGSGMSGNYNIYLTIQYTKTTDM